MLILTHTDRFRINLNQFCKRILYTSCNGSRTSLSHIKVREFLCSQFACRIHRCSCLICDNILHLFFRDFFEHIHDHLLRFAACCTVSYGNKGYSVFLDHSFYSILGSTDLFLSSRSCGINNCCIQNFTCCIYNCQLTACTERRVPSKYDFACDWRLHQKLFQILAEYMDRAVFCLISKITADFSLDSRSDQTFVTVFYNCFQNRSCIRVVFFDHSLIQITKDVFLRCIYFNSDKFLFLTTV